MFPQNHVFIFTELAYYNPPLLIPFSFLLKKTLTIFRLYFRESMKLGCKGGACTLHLHMVVRWYDSSLQSFYPSL